MSKVVVYDGKRLGVELHAIVAAGASARRCAPNAIKNLDSYFRKFLARSLHS
jgi:hypothetical protein